MPTGAKTVFIKTYGCQMNVYDSGRMAEALAADGYLETDRPEGADLVLLNTCHIREKAAEKLYSEVGRMRRLKEAAARDGRRMRIAVAGCVAQAEGEEIIARAPAVDAVVGPQSYHRLADVLARAEAEGHAVLTDMPAESKFAHLPMSAGARRGAVSRFLTVQEGCDKFCTFCVVPYTRGAEASRPVADLVAEATRLVAEGAREVTLLGQNVNAYHGQDERGRPATLARLLERLSEIEGLLRLRYTTSHPRDMGDDLVRAHRDLPKLMPYLHLPVQSGSDRVLKAMNRRHTASDYLRLIERLRSARGDLALSSDFIVGFPGETEADFAATLALVREVGYASAYSFKYSPRPGTPAAELATQVPESVKDERLQRLQALVGEGARAFNAPFLGRRLDILVERPGRRPGQVIGRSPYLHAVHVEADAPLGLLLPVAVTGVGPNSLAAALADAA